MLPPPLLAAAEGVAARQDVVPGEAEGRAGRRADLRAAVVEINLGDGAVRIGDKTNSSADKGVAAIAGMSWQAGLTAVEVTSGMWSETQGCCPQEAWSCCVWNTWKLI